MLRSIADLRRHKIHAIDGEIGAVHDLCFDDREWVVRYFVIDTVPWLPSRKVLVSPVSVGHSDWSSRRLRVMLTRDQIKEAPDIRTEQPVSREFESRLAEHYAWPQYWAFPDPAVTPVVPSARQLREGDEVESGDPDAGRLRSAREVAGYNIAATDGSIGHVQDFLVDDSDWTIRYLVVDTRNWLAVRRVILPPNWIRQVDWQSADIVVDVEQQQVRDAPAYDPDTPIDRAYEVGLYDFYGRPGYWKSL